MALAVKNREVDITLNKEALFKMLDAGIDDMEQGRELPLEEAFLQIDELRDKKRNARK